MQPAVEIAAAASEGRPFSMEQFLEEVEKALIDAGIAEAFELFLDKN
jgi:hypothetical protein